MILGIDHIGLATDDPSGVADFMSALGMRKSDEGTADDYGVACEFWRYSDGIGQPAMEVVSPVREDSAIGRHLERNGAGLYHVAFAVDDVKQEFDRLRERGFVAVDAEPCQGARKSMHVVFMYARRPAGLLIELVQYG